MKLLRTNNDGVISAWRRGDPARNSRRSLYTDGKHLFSYHLVIGAHTGNTCVVADYTAATGSFQTQTTSCHVGLAKRAADLVMHPRVWMVSPLSKTNEEVPF